MRTHLKASSLAIMIMTGLVVTDGWSNTQHNKHHLRHQKISAKKTTAKTKSHHKNSHSSTKLSARMKKHIASPKLMAQTKKVSTVKTVKLASNTPLTPHKKLPTKMTLAMTDAKPAVPATVPAPTPAPTPKPVKPAVTASTLMQAPVEKPTPTYKKLYSSMKTSVKRYIPTRIPRLFDGNPYIKGGVGAVFPFVSDNNEVSTGAGWPNDLYVTQSISNAPTFFLAGGYTWDRPTLWFPYYSVGVTYMYNAVETVNGFIDQYSLPAYRNYNYEYHLQSQNVLAIFKADIYRFGNFMPYATAGGGFAINRVSNYSEQALSGVTPRVSPGFASQNNVNLAFIVGGGFDYILNDRFWLNLEYNYGHYGTIETGKGASVSSSTGNFSSDSLQNTLTASTILFGVTYYPENF